MNVTTPIAAVKAAAPLSLPPENAATRIIEATRLVLANLEQGHAVDAAALRAAMEQAFGGSDAEGCWTWKSAYEACEAAQLLFLRRFGAAMEGWRRRLRQVPTMSALRR